MCNVPRKKRERNKGKWSGKSGCPVGSCDRTGSGKIVSVIRQGGGDRICECGQFECRGLTCTGNNDIDSSYDNLYVIKDNCTDDLLRFKTSINLGSTTIAANKALVDGGASTNFMSADTYQKIINSGGKYSVSNSGWMRVTAAGWESPKERRKRVTVRIEIGSTYSKDVQFTVFS